MKIGLAIIMMMIAFPSFGLTAREANEWREDIDVYAMELASRHIDPFHSLPTKLFSSEVERIKQSLPDKTSHQILVELMRLTHSINDGHTSFPLWGQEFSRFPLELKMFGADLYVVKTTRAHDPILGAKLIAINGVSSEKIIQDFSQLTPFSENQFSTAVRVAEYIPIAALLKGLGIIQGNGNVKFLVEVDGKQEEHWLSSTNSPSLGQQLTYGGKKYFTREEEVNQDLWFGASADNKIIYVKFRRYAAMSAMESLAEDLLAFINKNRSRNLIIDLRDNYGGDFFVGLKLAQLLVLADSIDWKSGVYVLIDHVTFSAAMSNAAQFAQLLNAKLVGTPTGARPSGYQDMGQFTLPHSGLEVTYSKRLYHFKEDQKDALYPDVNIELSIEDYKNKNDRQLNWVLKDIVNRSDSMKPKFHWQ